MAIDCLGEIIPAGRLPYGGTWQGIAGVPGGIPNRTNIFVNVLTTTNSYYRCVADGVTDNLIAIESALYDCPRGQVVYLPTGIYYVSGAIRIYSGGFWTLRGDGQGKTIITGGDGNGMFSLGSPPWLDGWPDATPILDGATNGSTSIMVGSATNLAVGQMMWLEQLNDGINVFGFGAGGQANVDDRLHDNTHILNCRALVTNITGNVVGFIPALTFDFNTNLSPQVAGFGRTTVQRCGIEDLTIYGSSSGPGVSVSGAFGCWLKDVELTGWNTFGVWFQWSASCEIREMYIHEPAAYDWGKGYPLQFDDVNNSLVEDNLFWHNQNGLIVQGGSGGNVFGYNCLFETYSVYPSGPQFQLGSIYANHTPYPYLNLYEGNYANEFKMDFYYGPGATSTVLRNYLTGTGPDITQNRICVSLDSHQWSNNIVGNILGSAGTNATLHAALPSADITWVNTTPLSWVYDPGTANNFSYNENVIFRLGYPDSGDNGYGDVYSDGGTNDLTGLDALVRSNTIIHGNWDYASQSITWSPDIADTNIPNSYYLTGQPSWWGNSPWPPYDPNNPTAASMTSIPAGYRFVFDPNPSALLAFLLNTNLPKLHISLTDSNTAVVAWPGYMLQQNSDLTTTNWVNVTNAINLVGNEYQAVVSPSSGQQYYRLKSTVSTPSMFISLTATNTLLLAWPGYILQQNSDLTTMNWVNATNPITVVGCEYHAEMCPSVDQLFYRLRFFWTP